ncbi:MAG: hypothetical protein ACBZ72_13280 [Candidatus Bathyarchaeia archaeon]
MKSKNRLKNRLRGWLPKEPTRPEIQKTRATQVNPKPKPRAVPTQVLGASAFGTLFAGLLLLVVPYYVFPQFYSPKANPVWGYTSPITVEGGVMLAAALALIVASLFVFTLWGLRLNVEGSKWLRYRGDWFTPKARTEKEIKAVQLTAVVNAVMVGTFLGAHWLVDRYTRSSEVSAVFWAVFIPTVVLVNFLLYRHFKAKENVES